MKKIEKKNTIIASFQVKTSWERPRTSENKIFVSSISYLIRNRELIKKSIKIQKIRKQQYGFFSGQNKLGKAAKE